MFHKAPEKSINSVQTPRIVVLGVGNMLMKDEGIGIHVIEALAGNPLLANINVEILDGGTSPDILHLLGETGKLIIVDAVKGGDDPGSIYRFHAQDITVENNYPVSLHQLSLFESLDMMDCMGDKPEETVIIGVEPKEIRAGLELSPELEQKVPQIVKLVLDEIMEETTKC
ncbi:MAG: HyaD/HybD family hydrogenase maturation endopeptidase [Chloroflexi bacterium]|nr:HyaD/HybD family hydrogenase maturation endopeptidase [Chloroflexota bacterium]MBT7082583.1 HyaD/HybD family hydrogenase maturation endopeptidase [Chloroflexota bacterium]MBT7289128.1 HyaD/HybD family hydrogenase maturation endopeptidase [Chloroflexota bacterium]